MAFDAKKTAAEVVQLVGGTENISSVAHCMTRLRFVVKDPVSYTHLRAHETDSYLVCRLLLEKKKK